MDILMTSSNEHSCSSSTAKHKFMETTRKHSNYQDDETASSSSSNSEGGFTEDNEHQNTIDKLSFQKNKDIMVSLANELGGNVNGHFDLSTTNPEFLALLTKSFVENKDISSSTGQQQQQTPLTTILTANNGKTGVINNNNIKDIDCLMKPSSNSSNSHQLVLGIIGDDTSSNGSIEGTENLESNDGGNRSSPSDDYHQINNHESRGSSQQPDGSILQGNGLKQIVNGTSPWMRSAGRKKTHPVWQFFKDLKDCGLDENGVICLNCDWKGDDKSPNNLKTHLKRCHEHDGIYEKFTQALAKTPTQPYVKRNRAGGFQNPYGLSTPIPVSQSNPLFNSGTSTNPVDVFAQLAASQIKTAGDVSGLDFKNDPINNFLGNLPIPNDINKLKEDVGEGNGISTTLGGSLHGISKNDLDEPLVKKIKGSDSLDINGLLGLQNNSFMLNKLESQHNVNEMLGQLSSMNPFIFAAAAINQSNNVGGGGNLLQQLTSQSNDITKITTPFGNGLVSPPKQPSNQSTPGTGTSQQQQTFTSSTSQGHQVNGICQQQSSSSNNNTTTSTPSGSTNFTLSDNFCIQSLISIAKDMNIALTYTSDSTNIDEFTLSCKGPLNTPNFHKKSVVLKDFPDEIKIYERTGDMLSESEAWRKTEWSQMQWALRGKVQNILFK